MERECGVSGVRDESKRKRGVNIPTGLCQWQRGWWGGRMVQSCTQVRFVWIFGQDEKECVVIVFEISRGWSWIWGVCSFGCSRGCEWRRELPVSRRLTTAGNAVLLPLLLLPRYDDNLFNQSRVGHFIYYRILLSLWFNRLSRALSDKSHNEYSMVPKLFICLAILSAFG